MLEVKKVRAPGWGGEPGSGGRHRQEGQSAAFVTGFEHAAEARLVAGLFPNLR